MNIIYNVFSYILKNLLAIKKIISYCKIKNFFFHYTLIKTKLVFHCEFSFICINYFC